MKKQKHDDDKPQFQTSRDLVAHAAHRFLVMLDQRLNGEKRTDDASYFRMPDGRHFDELVAQLQGMEEPSEMCDMFGESMEVVRDLMGEGEAGALRKRAERILAADPEKAKGSSDFLQSYGKKMRARVEREQADKLRPATRTERRYAVEGIDPKVARESGE